MFFNQKLLTLLVCAAGTTYPAFVNRHLTTLTIPGSLLCNYLYFIAISRLFSTLFLYTLLSVLSPRSDRPSFTPIQLAALQCRAAHVNSCSPVLN